MAVTVGSPTRFPELRYLKQAPHLWRIIAVDTGSAVGPHYKTRAELLGDLERFASLYGCADAAKPSTFGLTLAVGTRAPPVAPVLRGRPSVKQRTDGHSSERIAEVCFPDGTGCLLSLRVVAGVPILEVYRADAKLRVVVPADNVPGTSTTPYAGRG